MRARLACASLAALALAGCGSDSGSTHRLSKAEYRERLQQITSEPGGRTFHLALAISRAPTARLIPPRLRLLRTTLLHEARALQELRPPADAEEANAAAAAALRDLVSEATRLAGAAGRSYRPLPNFQDDLSSSGPARRLARALDELRRRGYIDSTR